MADEGVTESQVRHLLTAAVLTFVSSVLAAAVLFTLLQPKYHYFQLDKAPMRVEVKTGVVELLDMDSGKWVTFEQAKRILEKRK